MVPPATRTSFKRAASDEEDSASVASSKRAKPSNRSTKAQTPSQESSNTEPPKRFTPDGREIPYIKPRPNGSWRMITGEDLVYTPEERPTRAPASAYKQTTINQSFGQSTYSGRERRAPPQHKKSTSNASKANQTTKQAEASSSSSNQPKDTQPSTSKPKPSSNTLVKHIRLAQSIGDIFTAPPCSLLLHACNTEGSWGAGIALAFKESYPDAYETYRTHCRLNPSDELIGTALLIPPSHEDAAPEGPHTHFIGCLFTSVSKGQKKDSPEKILDATGKAVRDLIVKVREWNASEAGKKEPIGEVRMCKINSGLFGVKWEHTRAVIEGLEVEESDDDGIWEIRVISRSDGD